MKATHLIIAGLTIALIISLATCNGTKKRHNLEEQIIEREMQLKQDSLDRLRVQIAESEDRANKHLTRAAELKVQNQQQALWIAALKSRLDQPFEPVPRTDPEALAYYNSLIPGSLQDEPSGRLSQTIDDVRAITDTADRLIATRQNLASHKAVIEAQDTLIASTEERASEAEKAAESLKTALTDAKLSIDVSQNQVDLLKLAREEDKKRLRRQNWRSTLINIGTSAATFIAGILSQKI